MLIMVIKDLLYFASNFYFLNNFFSLFWLNKMIGVLEIAKYLMN
jgi:hypothetical protein